MSLYLYQPLPFSIPQFGILTRAITVLFSVVVIQWVTSPDGPQGSNSSSKNDSRELGSQNGDPEPTGPVRRFGSGGRRGNDLSELEDYDTPDRANRSRSRASSRRELSAEDGRAGISHARSQSGSTDTLPSSKPFAIHVRASPATTQETRNDVRGAPELTPPEEVRVRGNNLYVSRIWRPNP